MRSPWTIPGSQFVLFSFTAVCCIAAEAQSGPKQPVLPQRGAAVLTVDGLRFRDLNRDGQLEPYEDWRLPAADRARDLVQRMSLEEKAGLMMHGSAPAQGSAAIGRGAAYDLEKTRDLILGKKVTTLITRLSAAPAVMAEENNKLQAIAEEGRWGVPLTISTDPRNSFTATVGASNDAGGFSKWPDMPGFGALNDRTAMAHFAEDARQEYLAVGIQEALSPQADLATEPRWPRIDGTFGEDATIATNMVNAYIRGFQDGDAGLHPGSVMCVVKHWAGYGAMKDGWDAHNSYGRHAVFPGGNFAYHLKPFEGAFAAHVAAVMPTYAILDGVKTEGEAVEPVAAGYSKVMLTDVLRKHYGFNGVVLSDWLITSDCVGECLTGAPAGVAPTITPGKFGMPWGVETLTPEQRYAKALLAGVDQFGGVSDSDLIVSVVHAGQVPEARIDESAQRILVQKFELGLFENPYVDAAAATQRVGTEAMKAEALRTQERSMVLLVNKSATLPLKTAKKRVYLVGVSGEAARAAGLQPVTEAGQADVAVVRFHAPYQLLHPGYFFGSRQHEGDLDFKQEDPQMKALAAIPARVPVVAAVYLDRPAILTALRSRASAILANFGASDEALLAVVTGQARPEGKLPFELPSTMGAVRAQKPDVPHDSGSPLFPLGFGLSY